MWDGYLPFGDVEGGREHFVGILYPSQYIQEIEAYEVLHSNVSLTEGVDIESCIKMIRNHGWCVRGTDEGSVRLEKISANSISY
jgi:hypothetical protein